jgi:hypothetical protein
MKTMKNGNWRPYPGALTNQEYKDWVNERNARWGLIPPINKEETKNGMQPNEDARGVSAGIVCNELNGAGPERTEGPKPPQGPSEWEGDALLFTIPSLPGLSEERVGEMDDGVPKTWEADEVGV